MDSEKKDMPRCVIVGASEIKDYHAIAGYLKDGDHFIYCDGGLKHREGLCREPDLIVGDFDSYRGRLPSAETIILPREKDDTDTVYAVKEACLRGFRDFLLIGVTGGRLDHTLGNLYILKNLRERSAKAMIVDDMSEMELVGSETVETEDRFPLFSLIAIAGEARGVDISDAKYELKNGSILPSYQYGISNETLRGKTARVSVESGVLLLIRYRKGDV